MVELPSHDDLFLPMLAALDEIGSAYYQEVDRLALEKYGASPEQWAIEFPESATHSGPKILLRTAWTRSGLKRVGAVESVAHGFWDITDVGREYLSMDPADASSALLVAVPGAYEGKEPTADIVQHWMDTAARGEPVSMSARELIEHWGVRRRWPSVVERIEDLLRASGLRSVPSFAAGGLDEVISLEVIEKSQPPSSARGGDTESVTKRVGHVASARGGVVHVTYDESLTAAQSKMYAHDYSQLAVMNGARTLKGAVSWESIAKERRRNPEASLRDCIVVPREVNVAEPLLDIVPEVVDHGFVMVRDEEGRVSGIVTAADLGNEFLIMSRPFLLIGEIELWLRRAIDRAFTAEELVEFVNPDDSDREIEAAHSLTLGEVERILQVTENWDRVGWSEDRSVFLQRLSEVRKLRNGVMHFSPDPPEDSEVRTLRVFLKWLREISY